MSSNKSKIPLDAPVSFKKKQNGTSLDLNNQDTMLTIKQSNDQKEPILTPIIGKEMEKNQVRLNNTGYGIPSEFQYVVPIKTKPDIQKESEEIDFFGIIDEIEIKETLKNNNINVEGVEKMNSENEQEISHIDNLPDLGTISGNIQDISDFDVDASDITKDIIVDNNQTDKNKK